MLHDAKEMVMAKASLIVALVLVHLLATGACRAAEQPRAQLPRLMQPVVVDGDLGEWAGAVSVPVWSDSDICFAASGYRWGGPADVSMEAYCAWNREGLCLATVIADNVVENLRTDGKIYLEDSIELYVDGRRPEAQATSPYSAGAYQIMITPPLADRPVQVTINDRDGEIPDLRVAGKSTPTGYTIEVLIPWRAFPEFTPEAGAQIAFNFAVNDYDGSDPSTDRPVQLNRDGAQLMWEHPEGCLKWQLAEAPGARAQVASGPFVVFVGPSVVAAGMPPQFTATVGTLLSPQVRAMRFTAADWRGRLLLDRTVAISPTPAPWEGAVQATLDWPEDIPLSAGVVTVNVTVNGRDGGVLGTATRRVLVQGKAG
jgi:hypothetical protein